MSTVSEALRRLAIGDIFGTGQPNKFRRSVYDLMGYDETNYPGFGNRDFQTRSRVVPNEGLLTSQTTTEIRPDQSASAFGTQTIPMRRPEQPPNLLTEGKQTFPFSFKIPVDAGDVTKNIAKTFFDKMPTVTIGDQTVSEILSNPALQKYVGSDLSPSDYNADGTIKNEELKKTSKELDEELGKFNGMPSGESDPNWKSNYGTETKKEAKQKWYENIGNITQNFLNNLEDPTFQKVLAMHVEAKGGGDVTDVLQAGIKTSTKLTNALLEAKKNELTFTKANLDIINTLSGIGNVDPPSTSLLKTATSILDKNPYDLGNQVSEAAFALSSMAKALQVQNPNLYPDEYSALTAAIQLAESSGGITKDNWISWGGKFAPEKIKAIETSSAINLPTTYSGAFDAYKAANTEATDNEIHAAIRENHPYLLQVQ
jgi:hypothetical protein